MSLADALERAATALPEAADAIRPANGDPDRVLAALDVPRAARVLTWLLAEDPEAGAELADAWSHHEGLDDVLEAVDESALPKASRKGLRRVRHRLRSRGVALGEPTPEARVARLPGGGEEALEMALVSPFDPSGARIVSLVDAPPEGGARLFQVITDARRGIVECRVYTTTRGKARRFARDLAGRDQFAGSDVPPEAARAWLSRCAARQPADRPLPRAFVECRSRLVGEGATPGELVRAALGAGDSPRRAVELVRAGEIGPWIPAGDALRETAEKVQELAKGQIILTRGSRREQIQDILGDAIDSVFDEAESARVAEWLEETAYLLWKKESDDDARACLAATADPEVRRALLEVALAPVLARAAESGEGEGEEPSLVVKQ